MSWLSAAWRWLTNLFHRKPVIYVTVSATATLTSSGDLNNPKTGDVLTYTVTVTGDTYEVDPGQLTVAGTVVKVVGGPWTGKLPETFGAPTVAGLNLAAPFTQVAGKPNVWTATVA